MRCHDTMEASVAVSHVGGRFSLHCWIDPEGGDDNPDQIEYAESSEELMDRADALQGGGRYKRMILCLWDDGYWSILQRFSSE
jgi:hypothetical protein